MTLSHSRMLSAALMLACGLVVHAEDGFSIGARLRLGHQVGAQQEHLARRTLAGSVAFGYTAGVHRTTLELGYHQKPGDQYEADWRNAPIAPGVVVDYNVKVPAGANTAIASQLNSDLRRTELSGLFLRATYHRSLGEGPWGVQGGLVVSRDRFSQEYFGSISGVRNLDPKDKPFLDSYYGTPTRFSTSVAPFVGLTLQVAAGTHVELNLRSQSVKALDYVHVVGTEPGKGYHNTQDFTVTRDSRALHLELGVGFTF